VQIEHTSKLNPSGRRYRLMDFVTDEIMRVLKIQILALSETV
jgi:hypothetical protein